MPSGPPGRIEGTDYAAEFGPLLSSFGVPCTAPPWGELVAVDLAEAEIKWRVPLGTLEKVGAPRYAVELGAPLLPEDRS